MKQLLKYLNTEISEKRWLVWLLWSSVIVDAINDLLKWMIGS